MKSIKFSASELEFLQNHYELELTDAENYVTEIKNILKKLGVIKKEETAAEKPAKTTGRKRGRPRKDQSAPVAEAGVCPGGERGLCVQRAKPASACSCGHVT